MPAIRLLDSKLRLSPIGLLVASLGLPPIGLLAARLRLGPIGLSVANLCLPPVKLLFPILRLVSKGGGWSCGWGLRG